jgi:two-component system, NarL family, sensor kinase
MKNCSCFFVAIWFLVIAKSLPAQSTLIDSLQLEIKNAKSDSAQLFFRARLTLENAKLNFTKAQGELNEIKKLSLSQKIYSIYAYAVKINGSICYEKGDYLNAIIYYREVEKIYLALTEGNNKSGKLGGLYSDLGASYSLINDLENAQKYYTKSIELLSKLNDARLSLAYFNLAFVFIDMQEWQKALQYLQRSINSVDDSKPNPDLLSSYARAAAICFKLNKQKDGEELLAKCNSYLPAIKLNLDKIYYHNANAEYYYFKGDMSAALINHKAAYRYSLLWKDPYYVADEALDIGRVYMKLNQPDSTEKFLRIAFDTAKAYNYLPKIRYILNEWSAYYANAGDFKKAYQLRTESSFFTDSVVALQNHNHILLFDAEYESIKKENHIAQLEADKKLQQLSIKQKTILNYSLFAVILLALVIGFLAYRTYRQKQKLQQQRITELETEKQLAATEAVLKGEERERSRLAKDLHDGLGGMLSGIKYAFQTMKGNLVMTPENHQAFERSMDMLDSSIKEMRRVAHNMMPEALVKFGLDTALKDFCNDINQTGVLQINYQSAGVENAVIDQTTAITIYRIVQELINNTLKHAVAKSAIVQVEKANGEITLTIEDDGRGFDTAILQQSKGIGWSNIQSRVEFLKGKLDVKSGEGRGTSVLIELKA